MILSFGSHPLPRKHLCCALHLFSFKMYSFLFKLKNYIFKNVCVCVYVCLVTQLCPTLCDPVDCSPPGSSVHGDSPGKNTGGGSLSLLQGIFPTQGSNPGLPHGRRILYQLSHKGSPNQLCFNKNLKMNKTGKHLFTAFTSTHGAPWDQGQTSEGFAAEVRTGAHLERIFPAFAP